MANLAGKTALVVDPEGIDGAALADGIAAGLEESAATVQRLAPAGLSVRLAEAAPADVVVADLAAVAAALPAALPPVPAGPAPRLVVVLADRATDAASVRGLAADLAPAAITLLALRPATPGVTGRCVAALSMDPDIAEKSGGSFGVAELAREYRFSDPDAPGPG